MSKHKTFHAEKQKLRVTFWMEETPFWLGTLLDALCVEADLPDFTDFQPPVSILGTTVACTQTFGGTAELKSVKGFLISCKTEGNEPDIT